MSPRKPSVTVRTTRRDDFDQIIEMTRRVYPQSPPWQPEQLASHLDVFPEGQFVAVDASSGQVLGMAASLIILWDDYDHTDTWRDFTDHGMFGNHDPAGRTLYGAEVMAHPDAQRRGIGSKLYAARNRLVTELGLLRIRAAARLRHYHKYARRMPAEEYVVRIVRGEIKDPTLSFQLKHGFEVMDVVSDYLKNDPESLGYAAVIEWINEAIARPEDYRQRDPRYRRLPPAKPGSASERPQQRQRGQRDQPQDREGG